MLPTVSKKKLALKAVVSLAFFSILISFVQGNELALMFAQINWFYLLLSLILSPVMIVISCFKWKMILDAGGGRIPFRTLFRIYLIGYFFSNILPSTVGGDVVRSYYAGKLIKDQAYSAVAIFIERFSGVFFLLFLVILAPLLFPSLYKSVYVFIPMVISLTLLVIIIWLARAKAPFKIVNKIILLVLNLINKILSSVGSQKSEKWIAVINSHHKKIMERFGKLHIKLVLAVKAIKKNNLLILQLILITFLFYFLTMVNVTLAFLAFGVDHQFLHICALLPTISFVGQFPVTILGNLGFLESVYVFYLMLIGISANASLAMGLLLRVKMLLMGVIGFFVYLAYKQETGDDAQKLPVSS